MQYQMAHRDLRSMPCQDRQRPETFIYSDVEMGQKPFAPLLGQWHQGLDQP
jgi:hypothetical protein